MSRPSTVIIVNSSLILALGMYQVLEGGAFSCEIRTIQDVQGRGSAVAGPDLAIVAPQHWEQLADWVSSLRTHLAHCPWLIVAEPNVVGMFISLLAAQPCLTLDPVATESELKTAARALAAGQRPYVPAELMARFSRHAPSTTSGRPAHCLTTAELQCGCAVSLGLSNVAIATHLYIGEATVKSHVSSALRKLGLRDREALGAFIQRAFHPAGRLGGERSDVPLASSPVRM
jgi:DNA-binding NarL/FixJ family response regulator